MENHIETRVLEASHYLVKNPIVDPLLLLTKYARRHQALTKWDLNQMEKPPRDRRSYFDAQVYALEDRYERGSTDIPTLFHLAAELNCRSTRRSWALRKRVLKSLEDICIFRRTFDRTR